jgi:hypothetical protein
MDDRTLKLLVFGTAFIAFLVFMLYMEGRQHAVDQKSKSHLFRTDPET